MYVYMSIWAITLMICDHTYHHVTDFCFFDTHGTPYVMSLWCSVVDATELASVEVVPV